MFITMDTKKRRPWWAVSPVAVFTCATVQPGRYSPPAAALLSAIVISVECWLPCQYPGERMHEPEMVQSLLATVAAGVVVAAGVPVDAGVPAGEPSGVPAGVPAGDGSGPLLHETITLVP